MEIFQKFIRYIFASLGRLCDIQANLFSIILMFIVIIIDSKIACFSSAIVADYQL